MKSALSIDFIYSVAIRRKGNEKKDFRIPFADKLPAIKRDGKWINLISMEEMELDEFVAGKYPALIVYFQAKANNL